MDLDRLYLVLGFLDEFDGRVIFDDQPDFVECTDLATPETSAVFLRHLDALARERQIAPATRETDVHGRPVLGARGRPAPINGGYTNGRAAGDAPELRSLALAALINGCYSKVLPSGYADEHGRPIGRRMLVSHDMFGDNAAVRTLSYLAGAYLRDGEGNAFRIAGASHKVDLIADLLNGLGCSETTVTYRPGWVPRVHTLAYQPTPDVAAWLERARDL